MQNASLFHLICYNQLRLIPICLWHGHARPHCLQYVSFFLGQCRAAASFGKVVKEDLHPGPLTSSLNHNKMQHLQLLVFSTGRARVDLLNFKLSTNSSTWNLDFCPDAECFSLPFNLLQPVAFDTDLLVHARTSLPPIRFLVFGQPFWCQLCQLIIKIYHLHVE